MMRKTLLLLMIFTTLFTACNPCRLPKFRWKCCFNGRRPQVMATYSPWVLDPNCCCEHCDEIACYDCGCSPCKCGGKGEEESGLDPSYFTPFAPLEVVYKISEGDILEISVYGDEDTKVENAVIAPDGNLYYAFLEPIYAAGKTIQELGEEITEQMKEMFINPMVTVIPKETVGQTYKVLGRVEVPGVYPITSPLTVRDAIGEAGGLLKERFQDKDVDTRLDQIANLNDSFIIRDGKKLDVDFEKLLLTADSSQNIYMRPGDYIYIASYDVREVYILGAVVEPQRLGWIPGMTLMSALADSSGWLLGGPYGADWNRVLVIRGRLCNPCVIKVDLKKILQGCALDFQLKPGDIVYVPNKKFRFIRELVHLAIGTFVNSFVVSAGEYYASKWFPPPKTDDDDDN